MKCNIVRSRNYRKIWEHQRALVQKRIKDEIQDTILIVEHDSVLTMGRRDTFHDINNSDFFKKWNIDIERVERGGAVTYHGPGQLVAYPIMKIADSKVGKKIPNFISNLSQVMLSTLSEYGLEAHEGSSDQVGIYVQDRKIGFIGLSFEKWVSMHGISLNVCPDLRIFDEIIPCGLTNTKITSMQCEIGKSLPIHMVKRSLINNFGLVFGQEVEMEDSHI